MKATFKIVLFARTVKDGKQPVMFRVTFARKSKHVSLNRYALPEQWDEKTNRFKKGFPDYKRENELLRTLEQRASDILFDWERGNIAFSFQAFERLMFADRQGATALLWEYAAGIADALEKEERSGYADIFRNIAGLLKSYAPNARLSDLSANWLQGFEKWLRTKRTYKAGGLLHVLKMLRIVCNRAVKSGEMPKDWNPFNAFNLAHIRAESKPRAITLEQVRRLKDAPVESKFERLALDLFLFSFYCWGMNFADIANLTRDNIRDLRIEYVRQKTKRLYSINLSAPAGAILDRYRSADSHLFPIYRDAVENTEKKRHSRKKEIRQKVNDALKVIAERVGINPEHFTLYVARHTYATALKRAGFAHALIQDALGHADMRTTEGYLDKFENAALDSANAAILGEVV